MPKNKPPVPRKSAKPAEEDEDALSVALSTLALALADMPDRAASAAMEKEAELNKLIRKYLHQKNDDVLYDAVERARFADVDAYQLLRALIEEASATVVIRREGAPAMEINAFAIPLFVHSKGGLNEADGFQDQPAFEALVASFQQAGLESPQAKVVLLSHAYDPAEVDSITYSHLNEMVRDAWASMTDKKLSAAPALERSMPGWSASTFSADDEAVELRFLLGFALKRADDPFYVVPDDEAAADAYFHARMERYRQWTLDAAPLVRRCLAAGGAGLELNFLYQDLFFGAREQGMAEWFMLLMMTDVNHALAQHQLAPDQVKALVGPTDVDDQMVLQVKLYRADGGQLLATSEKPLDLGADLQIELDDIHDALATIGIVAVSVAQRFDQQGVAVDPRPYP